MMRKPRTVYFRHFEYEGVYMVFDKKDANICRAVTQRMVYREPAFTQAKARLERAGYRVEIATDDLQRERDIRHYCLTANQENFAFNQP
jgi:hypothetical protein